MSFWPNGKPSERIVRVLRGEADLAHADDATKSACRKHFYDAAVDILALPDKASRQAFLSRLPPLVRPHIEAETIRVHNMRRAQ